MELVVLETLKDVCLKYFSQMFDIALVQESADPELCQRPPFRTELYTYIGLAGDSHQGQLTLGFSKKFANRMIEKFAGSLEEGDREPFIRSAIGELLNNLSGMIASSDKVSSCYTNLSQSLPVINDTTNEGMVYFSKSDGGTFAFTFQDEKIHVFLGLIEFVSTQQKNDQDDLI